jgi:hypothetical protein
MKGKLLISLKHAEAMNLAEQSVKARLVAIGNVIFDGNLKVRSSLPAHDIWAPVCSVTGVRVVQVRATAHRRKTEGVDLVAAYMQVELGGDIPCYVVTPKEVVNISDAEVKAVFQSMTMPVYGLGGSGKDSIYTFGGWLTLSERNRHCTCVGSPRSQAGS